MLDPHPAAHTLHGPGLHKGEVKAATFMPLRLLWDDGGHLVSGPSFFPPKISPKHPLPGTPQASSGNPFQALFPLTTLLLFSVAL